jgi:exodeoxyribonuclease V beta subunit
MVESVLTTPLDTAERLYLNSVGSKQRLVELEFYFPLSTINAEALRNLLSEYDFAKETATRQAIERINFSDVSGFMKGFIDLVFEINGCFYLADYKSNWLGGELSDYSNDHLTQVMAHEHYYLQYLFYTLALHRYLSLRLPDYDYERHFGGAFYLFVRGMNPTTGSKHGIYWDKPSKQLINAMDQYLVVQ